MTHAQPTAPAEGAATPKSEDRSALVSVTVFPILVLVAFGIGFVFDDVVSQGASLVTPLLMIVMFGMGLTLRPIDFALVAKRPLPVLIGVVAQYVLMPAIALLVTWLLRLPPELAAGVILVGCAPGGTSSNVVTYLARGDVALSVTMTSVSTLLAPILTPLLTLWLAGQYMPVSAADMALSIVQIVLVPVILGLVLRVVLDSAVRKILPALPWVSVLAISGIVAIVVSGSADRLLEAGLLVLAAVAIHNVLGYTLGYVAGKLTRRTEQQSRTIAVEVGMQNSGLAAGLAAQYMSPMAALPGAVFSVWHNLSGAVLAAICRSADARAARRAEEQAAAAEEPVAV